MDDELIFEQSDTPAVQRGIHPTTYTVYHNDNIQDVSGGVIEEAQVCLFVNGQELATFMCSPIELQDLAFGFLRSEGFIERASDVRRWHITENGTCVDVWLNKAIDLPKRKIITAGCGGGTTFDDLSQAHTPLESSVTATPRMIAELMKRMHQSAELYHEVRGVHTSALSDGKNLAFIAQDIGRHNTVDRLWGQALQRGYDTADHILIASGRISSEMLTKAAKMGIPIVVSRTSPTSLSVELARAWNITVIGYCRGNQFRVYTAPQRIVNET